MAKQYRAVNKEIPVSETGTWTSLLKQIHMCSASWTLYFIHGLGTGAPTVFVPQIRNEWNSTAVIDDELASWFYSTSNLAAWPWIFILPVLTKYIGRKIPFIASCFAISIFFVILYLSSAPHHILIAQGIQGFITGSSISFLIHIIPEYCKPKYRSMFLNFQCTSFYWGIWVSNAIGTFYDWRYIPVMGLIFAIYTFSVSFYPESPRWLASKGKFKESEAAHRWIFGCNSEAEAELQDLIDSQKNYPEKDREMTWSSLLNILRCKQFYMPLFLVILIGAQYNLSGKFVCSIYAIDFLKKITKDESTAYTGMLILDGVTVLGMYIGSFLPKLTRVRPLFLKLSILSVCTMFTFSLYLYLAKLEVIPENTIVTLGFLVIYSLAISSGPIMLSISIYGEIISIKYEAISFVIASFVFLIACTGMLKFTPILFKELGIHGSFLFFGISSGIATILIYIYLPETKNKTLVEIEEFFKDKKRSPEAESLRNEVGSEKRH